MSDIQALTERAHALGEKVDFWNNWMIWALIAAAVAAAIVVITTRMAIVRAGELAEMQEQIIAFVNKQAADANARAGVLEKDAASLKKDAEDERLARVNIEAAVAFRSLDEQQKRGIAKALSRFGNITGASMWYANGSPEAESFAVDIAEALRLAHIHTTTIGGVIEMREGGGNWGKPIEPVTTGVDISSTTNPTARELAGVLMKELAGRGFDVALRADQLPKDNKPPSPLVWVTVQARPKGPQGAYKLQGERDARAKNKNK